MINNNKQTVSNSAYLKSKYTIEDIETKTKNLNQAYKMNLLMKVKNLFYR